MPPPPRIYKCKPKVKNWISWPVSVSWVMRHCLPMRDGRGESGESIRDYFQESRKGVRHHRASNRTVEVRETEGRLKELEVSGYSPEGMGEGSQVALEERDNGSTHRLSPSSCKL